MLRQRHSASFFLSRQLSAAFGLRFCESIGVSAHVVRGVSHKHHLSAEVCVLTHSFSLLNERTFLVYCNFRDTITPSSYNIVVRDSWNLMLLSPATASSFSGGILSCSQASWKTYFFQRVPGFPQGLLTGAWNLSPVRRFSQHPVRCPSYFVLLFSVLIDLVHM